MTPDHFVAKWAASRLKERSAAHEHFIDLCYLLGELTPAEADSRGDWYCFERGASRTDGGNGWADVWRKGHFAWEYKGKHKDLNIAFAQLQLSISLFLGQSFHQFVTRLSSQTLA
jgi:hypothetical protein